MSGDLSKKINDVFIYGILIFLVFFFVLSSFPNSGIVINQNHLVILAVILVLLLFRYFSKIEIKGLLNLTNKIDEVKDEAKELRHSINKIIVNSHSNATAVVNVTNTLKEDAKNAKEIKNNLQPLTEETKKIQSERDRIMKFIDDGEFIAAFAVLRNCIESLMLEIVRIAEPNNDFKHTSWIHLIQKIRKLGLLKPEILDAITLVRQTSNTIIHTSHYAPNIKKSQLVPIADLGLQVVAELKQNKEYLIKNREYFTGWE